MKKLLPLILSAILLTACSDPYALRQVDQNATLFKATPNNTAEVKKVFYAPFNEYGVILKGIEAVQFYNAVQKATLITFNSPVALEKYRYKVHQINPFALVELEPVSSPDYNLGITKLTIVK